MRAFIVRPFGVKQDIDFDAVERDLLHPALTAVEVHGRTTAEIAQQGNIRSDMFELLLTADVVVADISIHNANVYYELGIRHALRAKRTVLIRANVDAVPFDLLTDRYLAYDPKRPADSLKRMVYVLRSTLASDDADSPVFRLLPRLAENDPTDYLVLPRTFSEESDAARDNRDLGKLALLAAEALGFSWEKKALHHVADTQFALKDWEGARTTLEALARLVPTDATVNARLGSVYQRLDDLSRSDRALTTALERGAPTDQERAELHALLGSNEKVRWRREWNELDHDRRGVTALQSPHLDAAIEHYAQGFASDQNHCFSGANAHALLSIKKALAERLSDQWNAAHDSDALAAQELRALGDRCTRLAGAVSHSAAAARQRREFGRWAAITEADLALLVSDRPPRVAALYRSALSGASAQEVDAVARQLTMLADLELFPANVATARAVLDEIRLRVAAPPTARVLLFTGHRLDAPGRSKPRFPPASEALAREMIRAAIARERRDAEGVVVGMAGMASGGDLLFHEECAALGIETEAYLAGPRDAYVAASVQDGGADVRDRFDQRWKALWPGRVHVLADRLELPPWLVARQDYSVWERSNRWLLETALAANPTRVRLIALWDGEGDETQGGTRHMVELVNRRGGRVTILDAARLASGAAPGGEVAAVTPVPVPRVFISHANEDRAVVEQTLLPLLAGAGITTWYSGHQLTPGDLSEQNLRDAILASDWLLLVMSPDAEASQWVKDELHLALEHGKRVLPLRLKPSEPDAYSVQIARIQPLAFDTAGAAASRLLAALRTPR